MSSSCRLSRLTLIVVAAVALTALPCLLQQVGTAAPADDDSSVTKRATDVRANATMSQPRERAGAFTDGPGQTSSAALKPHFRVGRVPTSLPIAPVVTANPYDDEPSRLRAAGLLKGPMPLPRRMNGIAGTQPCTFDIQCDDGDPCTDDFCDIAPGAPQNSGVCNNEVVENGLPGDHNGPDCDDGLACNGEETCQGANVIACEGTCVGGENPGDPCNRAIDCRRGGTCANQVCAGTSTPCVDNIDCGSSVGVCISGTPISCAGGEVCDENADPIATCVPPCSLDADCQDGIACNGVEVCGADGVCRSPGNPCGSAGATCLEQMCLTGGPGVAGNYCEADGDCDGTQGSCGFAGPYCKAGRCCSNDRNLSPNPMFAECNATGGDWYPTDYGSVADDAPQVCPLYSSGIGNAGRYYTTVGPASLSPLPYDITDDFLVKLGDDYDTGETDFVELEYLRFAGGVTTSTNGRIAFEFYDDNGNFVEDVFFPAASGISTQAVYVFALAPAMIIPPRGYIVGHVLQSFAGNTSARGEFYWLSTDSGECPMDGTCIGGPFAGQPCCGDAACNIGILGTATCDGESASCGASCTVSGDCVGGVCSTTLVDSGTNDPNTLYISTLLAGTAHTVANFLAVCTGGDRDGLPCDGDAGTGDALPDCPGGTCDPVPGVLAFELEGSTTPDAPFGGCCDPDALACNEELQWVCLAHGGNYLGDAVPCASCSDDSLNVGSPCRTCTGGTNAGNACIHADDCPGGTCDTNDLLCGYCEDLTTPCATAADCGGGTCTGTCQLAVTCNTGSCCVAGECQVNHTAASCFTASGVWNGLGTDCDPDCCVQAPLSGSDDCETAPVTLVEIPAGAICQHGPNKGNPCTSTTDCGGEACERTKVITLTGDNSSASSTWADPDGCNPPSDVPGGELGYFEAFQIYDPSIRVDDTIPCAYMLVDHCCTEPVKIPAYRILYNSCPCGKTEYTKPNPNHPDDGAGARGAPYCLHDNAWQRFGPLSAAGDGTDLANGVGTYYYPIVSILAGDFGQYQLHLRAEACPDAVCCIGADCKLVNVLECQALGGAFLAPPNRGEAVTICAGQCNTGSCCTGPGECVDNQDPSQTLQIDVDQAWCDAQGGKYVGGFRCYGGTCYGGDREFQSCSSDAQCTGAGGFCSGVASDLAQPSPCPICEIQGPSNCQLFDDSVLSRSSDRGMPGGATQAADDFRPLGSQIDKVCVWGSYVDHSGHDCANTTTDNFQVAIYGADAYGLPDVATAQTRVVSVADMTKVTVENSALELLGGPRVFGYQFDLSADPITGLFPGDCYWLEVTNRSIDGACGWNWMGVDRTNNDYSAQGWSGGYGAASPRNGDLAFCLSSDFEPGACGSPLSYCCNCDGTCSNETRRDCISASGQWRVDGTCETLACNAGAPVNDLCETVVQPAFEVTPDGVALYDNSCALTDGVNPVSTEISPSAQNVHVTRDLWYKYITTCSGEVRISTCASASDAGLDTLVVAYKDPVDPTQCICPTAANHDNATSWYTEPAPGSTTWAINAADENCDGIANAGGGFITGNVEPGECIMIRVGGFGGQGDETGAGAVSISCQLTEPGDPVKPVDGGNRYIRVIAPDGPGGPADEILRVRFVSLDGYPLPTPNYLYVGAPFDAPDEESSQPGMTFTAAPLSCEPYFHNWSGEGGIAIFGAEIMPGSTYEVQRTGLNCPDLSDETCWSTPVTITTQKYGDVTAVWAWENISPQPDFNDIAALVNKFLATPGAPPKAICQLQPNVVFPDRAIDFRDIAADVQAFLGVTYASSYLGPCTCPSTVACGVLPCANDLACAGVTPNGGLCVGGFCTDPCGRCTPPVMCCLDNLDSCSIVLESECTSGLFLPGHTECQETANLLNGSSQSPPPPNCESCFEGNEPGQIWTSRGLCCREFSLGSTNVYGTLNRTTTPECARAYSVLISGGGDSCLSEVTEGTTGTFGCKILCLGNRSTVTVQVRDQAGTPLCEGSWQLP